MRNIFKELNREDFKELVALFVISLSFVYMFCVTFIAIPEQNQQIANIILGSLLTIVFGKVLGEYFDAKPKSQDNDVNE